MSDGLHYRYYENESGYFEDHYLFWLIEYRIRNHKRQLEHAARLAEDVKVNSAQIDTKPLERIYFDEDALPILPPLSKRQADELVREIAANTFHPLVNSSFFEIPPSARLVIHVNSRPHLEFNPAREYDAVKREIDLLLSYFYEIKKPAKITVEASNLLLEGKIEPTYKDYSVVASHATRLSLVGSLTKRQAKDSCRAIGLWLYDYIDEYGGSQISAIHELKRELGQELTALGYVASEETVFRRFYHNTLKCIANCAVQAFK
jgi:hypothetical protein